MVIQFHQLHQLVSVLKVLFLLKCLKTRPMFEEGNFDADFDDIVNMVNEAIKNVEGDTNVEGDIVNSATTRVSAASVIPDVPSNVSTAGPSTSTAEDIFEDEMMTITDTLMAIRSTRPRITSVMIRDVEEEPS
ncbi:hypothetical protein Tco_0615900 [Tanacetum coccineum]